MNPYFTELLTFLSSNERTVLKLTCIIIFGVLLMARYVKILHLSLWKPVTVRAETREIAALPSWREFLQFIICMAVYSAFAVVVLLLD